MTKFEPVDYDPFAGATPTAPLGGGGGPKLEPVDYDPFAVSPTSSIGAYTGYPGMVRESIGQMGAGAQRIGQAFTPMPDRPRVGPFPTQAGNLVAGLGEAGAGAVGYATAPINAALRAVVGRPAETVGIPKEYAEFGASLALPIPKRIPGMGGARKPSAPTTEQLFEASDDAYKAARDSPFRLQPQETKQLADEITIGLKAEGYRDFTAPKTFRAIGEFKLDEVSNVADVDAVRKILSVARKDPSESDAARRAIAAIDDRLSVGVPEIAQARADWAAGSRAETIQEAVARGERAAGPPTRIDEKIINQIRAIRNSPKLRAGFSADELERMDNIIQSGGVVGKTAGLLGTALGGNMGAWGIITGSYNISAPVIGYGLRKIGNATTASQVAKLDEAVRSRSALGRAVGTSFVEWSKTAQAFETAPSVKAFVKASIASRNLVNTARGANISLSEESLLRALTGQPGAPGRAEENSPQVGGIP